VYKRQIMRSASGTVRMIEATHNLEKKPLFKDNRIPFKLD